MKKKKVRGKQTVLDGVVDIRRIITLNLLISNQKNKMRCFSLIRVEEHLYFTSFTFIVVVGTRILLFFC